MANPTGMTDEDFARYLLLSRMKNTQLTQPSYDEMKSLQQKSVVSPIERALIVSNAAKSDQPPNFAGPAYDTGTQKFQRLHDIGDEYDRTPSPTMRSLLAQSEGPSGQPAEVPAPVAAAGPTIHNDTAYHGELFPPTYNMQGNALNVARASATPKQETSNDAVQMKTLQNQPGGAPQPISRPTDSGPGFFSKLFNQPSGPTDSKSLWDAYNKSGSASDFVRASDAMKAEKALSGSSDQDQDFKRGGTVKDKKEDPIHHALSLISHLVGHRK